MILDAWRGSAQNFPANPFYERVLPFLPAQAHVLDAGAGYGQGAELLRSHGHEVTALEPDPTLAEKLRGKEFEVVEAGFEQAPLGPFDAVLCVFSLFFETPNQFPDSWQRLIDAIKPGGLWGGQVLGERDEWAGSQPVLTFSRPQIEALFSGFEVLEWEEAERRGLTAWGDEKDWHIHHIIARRT